MIAGYENQVEGSKVILRVVREAAACDLNDTFAMFRGRKLVLREIQRKVEWGSNEEAVVEVKTKWQYWRVGNAVCEMNGLLSKAMQVP